MKKNKPSPLIGHVLKKIAPEIGAKVLIEPEWNIAGQITFKNGKKSYFRFNSIGINTLGAAEISKDKDYANYFMRAMGYPVIRGKTFYEDEFCKRLGSKRDTKAACKYANSLGFPLIVKPNSGSQGKGVFLVHNERQFRSALTSVFALDRVVLVQERVVGNDFRIVVLDSNVISAYQRIPLNVIGDGRSTIRGLLRKKQTEFISASRDTRLRMDDVRIRMKLREQRLSFDSVLKAGHRVYLLDNANLSSGGDALDVTDRMHPAFKKFAVKLSRDMGLRLCAVDIMVDGDITKSPNKFWILEINSAPGLDHYAQTGRRQKRIVESLYLQVLKSMERRT